MAKAKISKAGLMDAAGLVAGAVGASFLTTKLPIANKYIQSGIPIAIGLVMQGQKSQLVKNIGKGMIAAGGAKIASALIAQASAPAVAGYMFSQPASEVAGAPYGESANVL